MRQHYSASIFLFRLWSGFLAIMHNCWTPTTTWLCGFFQTHNTLAAPSALYAGCFLHPSARMVRSSILRSLVSLGPIAAQKHGKKRTGKSRPEFKGENMKNMFTIWNDFVAKMLGRCCFLKPLSLFQSSLVYSFGCAFRQNRCQQNLAQYQVSSVSWYCTVRGVTHPTLGVISMLTKNNVSVCVGWRSGPKWPGQ